MLRKPPFPISPEELTEEILSESLGKEVNSFSYTRIGSDRGMLGVVLLLDISYSDGSTENIKITRILFANSQLSEKAVWKITEEETTTNVNSAFTMN